MTQSSKLVRRCPQCPSEVLVTTAFMGSLIDICPSCHGIWLDDGELQDIVRGYGANFRLSDKSVADACQFLETLDTSDELIPVDEKLRADALNCPVCARICFPTYYGFDSGIVINHCKAGHGVFLDDGELEAILIYSARSFGLVSSIGEELPIAKSPRQLVQENSQISGELPRRRKKRTTHVTEVIQPMEQLHHSRSKPILTTLRTLKEPVPVDVQATISRKGNLFFHSVRSPKGHWYPVRDGGTVKLSELSAKLPHYWIELKTGGALVLRQKGLHFEWILVGASQNQQAEA